MTLDELRHALNVYSLEAQQQVNKLWKDYTNRYIDEKTYSDKCVDVNTVMKCHIVAGWQSLEPEDQLTYYLESQFQSVLSAYLSPDQVSAIIIIQGSLYNYAI